MCIANKTDKSSTETEVKYKSIWHTIHVSICTECSCVRILLLLQCICVGRVGECMCSITVSGFHTWSRLFSLLLLLPFFLLLRCAGFLFIIVVWLAAEHIKHNVCVMTRKFYLVWLLSDKCSLRFCLRLGPLALPILSTALFLPLSSGFFLSRSSHPYCVNSYTLFIVLFSIVVCIVIFGLLVDNLHLLRFFFTQRALATFCPDKLWLFGRLFPIRVWLRMRVSLVGKFICIYLIIVHYMWLFVNFPFLLLASRTKFALTVSNAACMRVK